jgi:hypothetical protein
LIYTEPLFADPIVQQVSINKIEHIPLAFAAWRVGGKSYYVDGEHMDVFKDGLKLWAYTKRK